MAITVTIRTQGASSGGTDVTLPSGEGAIDTREEALAALAAVPSGQAASNMTFISGGQSLSYAEITGLACLGRIPHRTVFASQDNWVLSHPGQCMAQSTAGGEPTPLTADPNSLTLGAAEGVTVTAPSGGWPTGSQVFVDGTAHPEITASGNNPVVVPYSLLTGDGAHVIEVRSASRNYRIDNIRVVTPTAESGTLPSGVSVEGAGPFNGTAGQPLETITLLNTSSTAQQVRVTYEGGVQQVIPLPPSTTVEGTTTQGRLVIPVPADRLGAVGNHSLVVQVGGYVRPVAYTVGPVTPPVATLSAARVTSTSSYYVNDRVRIRVTSDRAGPARITVGDYHEDVTLTAGENNIEMSGAPKTWDTGGRAGRRETFQVSIQPLSGTTLAGAAVQAGSVSIQRQGGYTGRGRAAPPAARPPRL